MSVEAILKAKGREVATTLPTASVASAIHEFQTRNIGALVVSSDEWTVEGIISEREVVRGLARYGVQVLDMPISKVTSSVRVCSPHDTVQHVMEVMTLTRHRHLPVVDDIGKLCGIISIGDVVKNRLKELELEVGVLREAYIARR
jgi:CBS domain-containing protein